MLENSDDDLFQDTPPIPDVMMAPTGNEHVVIVSKTEKNKDKVYVDNFGYVWAGPISEKHGNNISAWRCELFHTVDSDCTGRIWLQKTDTTYKFVKSVTDHKCLANISKMKADLVRIGILLSKLV